MSDTTDPRIDGEPVTDPFVLAALNGIQERLTWPSMHWGVENVHPDAWPHIAKAAAAAVTARAHAPIRAVIEDWDVEHEGVPWRMLRDLRAVLDPAAATQHDTDIARQTLTDAADEAAVALGNLAWATWLRDRAAALGQPREYEVRPDIDAMERGEAPTLGQPHGQTGNGHE